MNHWVENIANQIEKNQKNEMITCQSGISPSGHIHLGNLREVLTVHFVCQELKNRGLKTRHIHSWDNFDRFRKSNYSELDSEIGKPLSRISLPNFVTQEFESYSDFFTQEFELALKDLNIEPNYEYQNKNYESGRYNELIKITLEKRKEIADILIKYQTNQTIDRENYYPLNIYCSSCQKDNTRILDYNNSCIHYTCNNCNINNELSWNEKFHAKLAWKIDWPMRWFYNRVDFEPGGEDHGTYGSSFTVGKEIIQKIFESEPPYFEKYAFVGISGKTKISSSGGDNLTPSQALKVYPPEILKWLYARKKINKKFQINFDNEVFKTYDEWDNFLLKNNWNDEEEKSFSLSSFQTKDDLKIEIPFRMAVGAIENTNGDLNQTHRIIDQFCQGNEITISNPKELDKRINNAKQWSFEIQREEDRFLVNQDFSFEIYNEFNDDQKFCIDSLLDKIDENWNHQKITKILYGIPKIRIGLSIEAEPNEEIKKTQRDFFIALYRLICNSDTGPRLPTLFLSLGKEKVKKLLGSKGV